MLCAFGPMAEPPPPIELSDDDVDDEQEMQSPKAMVPYVLGSPTKRPKATTPVTPSGISHNELVGLIQTTIQDSISSNFGAIQASVQNLADRTTMQEARMEKVEGLVQDFDKKHTWHFDSLRGWVARA